MSLLFFKNSILKFVNAPEAGVRSSQTLYEALFYSTNRYLSTREDIWYERSLRVALAICDSQLNDGGFDIGYDFIFGNGLRKSHLKEGTSPELLSVSALALFLDAAESRISGGEKQRIISGILKGVHWTLNYVKKMDIGCAIPYAPLTYDQVHITNATSFALSALSTSINYLPANIRADAIDAANGMYEFMRSELVLSGQGAAYWPYFYSKGALGNEKIDNYHIAQQLFHHCLAQRYVPSVVNLEIIGLVSRYLLDLQDSNGFVPYTNIRGRLSDKVDLWGFASLIPAFVFASYALNDSAFLKGASKVVDYIFSYCKGPDYFYPIVLNSSKVIFDGNFYPRSDAWVIHGISVAVDSMSASQAEFCDRVFLKILADDFSGLENHTLTLRKLLFAKVVRLVKAFV